MSNRWVKINEARGRQLPAPKVDAFLAEIDAVCERYGFTIEHEDGHGAFEVTDNESNRDWLQAAHVVVSSEDKL